MSARRDRGYRPRRPRAWVAGDGDSIAAADFRRVVELGETESEDWHQERLFQEIEAHVPTWPELRWTYHPPNGGVRPKGEAGWIKAQGVRYGIPDVCHPFPRGGFIGLRLELKSYKGGATPEQRDALIALAAAGHLALLVRGWRPAWWALRWYLRQDWTRTLIDPWPPQAIGFGPLSWAHRASSFLQEDPTA